MDVVTEGFLGSLLKYGEAAEIVAYALRNNGGEWLRVALTARAPKGMERLSSEVMFHGVTWYEVKMTGDEIRWEYMSTSWIGSWWSGRRNRRRGHDTLADPGTWCCSDHAIRGDVGEARRLSLSASRGPRLSRSLGPATVTCVASRVPCLVSPTLLNPTSARKDLQFLEHRLTEGA